VTLELTEREAEQILVAIQIGKVTLSMRALEGSGTQSVKLENENAPVWASDVSPALGSLEQVPPKGAAPVGPLQKARALIEVIHGDKIEAR
jgi:Flp pilus assembly protein CpaB